ncbi:TIGR04282 family arsenosugar biosynthesis glycosyltransferase [Pontimicrobium sp. MEBiC06410]
MTIKTHNTAILVFANSAKTEGIYKPFKQSAELFNVLNAQIQHKVKQTGLPYFIISEKQQQGHNFGTRFTNAIQSVFNKGFDNVITIGNDTPHLQTAHIIAAEKKLQNTALVLGPSLDGGFYLMGISKTHFNAETFLNLPWQTRALRQTILKLVALKTIDVALLETLSDIDSVSDAKAILNSHKTLSIAVKVILLSITASKKEDHKQHEGITNRHVYKLYYNKGSPLVLYT